MVVFYGDFNGEFHGMTTGFTLWSTNKKLLKMDIEILDLSIKKCDFPCLVGGLEHEFYDFPYIGNNPSH